MTSNLYCAVKLYQKNKVCITKIEDLYLANCQGNFSVQVTHESDVIAAEYGKKSELRIFINNAKTISAPVYVLTIKKCKEDVEIYLQNQNQNCDNSNDYRNDLMLEKVSMEYEDNQDERLFAHDQIVERNNQMFDVDRRDDLNYFSNASNDWEFGTNEERTNNWFELDTTLEHSAKIHERHELPERQFVNVQDDVNSDEINVDHNNGQVSWNDENEMAYFDSFDNSNDLLSINESSSENDENGEPFLDLSLKELIVPLIAKQHMSSRDYLLAILAISVRHRLNYETIVSMLQCAKMTLEFSDLPSTKKSLWKVLCKNESSIVRHYYCSKCKTFIGQGEITQSCNCVAHGLDPKVSYFIQVKIRPQLEELFKDAETIKHLSYRFTRTKFDDEAIEDIFDSFQYKLLSQPGQFLHNPHNYSFIFNTDGCKVANSANTSAWPIFLQINEFPPHLRSKHMILAGIWLDEEHPIMNEFCKPITVELKDLYDNGIIYKFNDETIKSNFIVTICSVDSKARPPILNMVHLNGQHGCTICHHPGEPLPSNHLHRVYPHRDNIQLRSHEEMKRNMVEAYNSEDIINGVRGPSFLVAFLEFNLVSGVVVESMHCVYLGVTRQITNLLLFSNFTDFGSAKNLRVIDDRLLRIKPPNSISRKPRSIAMYNQWKASEWRNWILFYCLPCLEDVITRNLLSLLALLSEAIYILNKSSITMQELDTCKDKLRLFSSNFETEFGIINMTFNVHLLNHLTDTVFNWGPLWVHYAFPFESWNHTIIKSVTSSNGRQLQIVTRFLMAKSVLKAQNDLTVSPETRNFIQKLFTKQKNNRQENFIGNNPTNIEVNEVDMRALQSCGFNNINQIIFYKKAQIYGVEYRITDAAANNKFCNSEIYFDNKYFGKILKIINFRTQSRSVSGFIVQVYKITSSAFSTIHFKKLVSSNKILFVNSSQNIKPAIFIKTTSLRGVSIPNAWEYD